jgi:putative tryptophan/tyrosine transport system substrate-binding protein
MRRVSPARHERSSALRAACFLPVIAATVLAAPFAAGAQQTSNVPRIGVLSGFSNDDPCLEALRRGLSELGSVESRTHVLEIRYSEGRTDTFPSLAADLVRMKPDLIISAIALGAVAMKKATASIPIVLASSPLSGRTRGSRQPRVPGRQRDGRDPLPPGTGRKTSAVAQGGRAEGFAHGCAPTPWTDPGFHREGPRGRGRAAWRPAPGDRGAARRRSLRSIRRRCQRTCTSGAQHPGPFFWSNRVQIAQLALNQRLPSLSGEPDAPEAGVLLFYGPYIFEGCQRAAKYVDRILKGAKPAICPSSSRPSLSS